MARGSGSALFFLRFIPSAGKISRFTRFFYRTPRAIEAVLKKAGGRKYDHIPDGKYIRNQIARIFAGVEALNCGLSPQNAECAGNGVMGGDFAATSPAPSLQARAAKDDGIFTGVGRRNFRKAPLIGRGGVSGGVARRRFGS